MLIFNSTFSDYYTPDMIGIKMDCEVLGELIKLVFFLVIEIYHYRITSTNNIYNIICNDLFFLL